jgi:hypothetical protein
MPPIPGSRPAAGSSVKSQSKAASVGGLFHLRSAVTLGSPLLSPGVRGCHGPVNCRWRTGEVICLHRPPGYPDETISPSHEIGLKRIPATGDGNQATGAVMLTFILNLIYREFLRSSLSGMRKHNFAR